MARNKILEQGKINIFTFILLVTAIIGVTWGFLSGSRSGLIYFGLIVSGMALIVFSLLTLDETNKKIMMNYVSTPFTGSIKVAIGSYYFGWFVIYFINYIGKLTQSFSTTQFFSPLYSSSGLTKGLSQSFQAGILESSSLSSWFYGVFVAGTIEELTFAFVLPLIFYIIALGIINSSNYNFSIYKTKVICIIISLVGSMSTFGYIHKLNATYVGYMFIIAMVFRLIVNSSIYVYGFVFAFGMGLHHGNNNISWIQLHSFGELIQALFTPSGSIFLILFGSGIIYLLLNYRKIWKETVKEIKSYKI